MAIDANVLVFERAREEYGRAPRPQGCARRWPPGFRKAWSAIADSNVTTLLAAGLLFFLASGPVRGFGVTLSIGVLASMVSALLVSPGPHRLGRRRAGRVHRPASDAASAGPGRVRHLAGRDSGPDLMKHGGGCGSRISALAVVVGAVRHRHPRA